MFIFRSGIIRYLYLFFFTLNVSVLFSQNCALIYSSVTYTSSATPVCEEDTFLFTASSSTGISGIDFSWEGENGTLDNDSELIYITSQAGPDTLFLVADYPGCQTNYDTLVYYIKADPENSLNLGPDQTFCEGKSTTLNASVADADSYLWSTGSASPGIVVSSTGYYSVSVTNVCNVGKDTVYIYVKPKPRVDLGGDREVCEGTPVVLDAGVANSTFLWTTGATSQTVSVSERDIEIGVRVDSSGCIGGDTITISDCTVEAQLPNAFTPNGDGNNDVLYVRGNNIKELDLKIYNRLGNLVFHGVTPEEGWDGTCYGKVQEPDVYAYILKVKMAGDTVIEKSGSILLIK